MSERRFKTTCFHDCWDACGMIATVRDGRLLKLEGDPDHPYTRGFLCGKMQHYGRWQHSTERLLHPLLRNGEGWQPISWDAALDLCVSKFRETIREYGPLAILYELGAGNFGMLRMMGRRFFQLLGGVTTTSGSLCDAAGETAQEEAFGACLTHDPRDVENSRCVVLWGRNVVTTHIHFLPFVKAARKQGAPLVVVDPLPTPTAKMADLWIQPRPGTDLYLAMAVGKILQEEGWVDEIFLRDHTEGWAVYRVILERHSLEDLGRLCDVPLARIRRMSEMYARTKPASIWTGMGMQHYRWGRETHRCVSALGAMTGNLGVAGGGVSFDHPSASSFDKKVFERGIPPASRSRAIPKPIFGEALAALDDPPARVAWFQGSNLVNQSQDTEGILKALSQVPFKVALEIYLTDTAKACDLVLPVSAFLEREDVRGSYGDRTVGYMPKVLEPMGEARSDLDIYQALAERLGFGRQMAGDAEGWIRKLARPLEEQGIPLHALREKAHAVSPLLPEVPFAGGRFATPSGRYHFLALLRLPEESEVAAGFSLRNQESGGNLFLITPKGKPFQKSIILEEEDLGMPKAILHPQAVKGLRDGEEVDLVSSVGRLRVRVVLDVRMRPDTVWVDEGGHYGRGAGVNALAPSVLSWDGGGACFYETRVRLEKT
ncbi:MAG: molybdopterin-dependent oxidoreductase [Nitrospirae bacterium]|nr:molybdopterin-dependent oxidoreductase [Nitrospirota bacterium]